MRRRAEMLRRRGLLAPGQQSEELVVIEARVRAAAGARLAAVEAAPAARTCGSGPTMPPEPARSRVVVTADGPVLVPGPVEVVTPDGRRSVSDRPVTALCVCGKQRPLPVLRHQPPTPGPLGAPGGRMTTLASPSPTTDDPATAPPTAGPPLPAARGPLSAAVLERLRGGGLATPGAWPTPTRTARTCSWRCTWPTSCTTAGSRASTTTWSGTPT